MVYSIFSGSYILTGEKPCITGEGRIATSCSAEGVVNDPLRKPDIAKSEKKLPS